MDNAEPSTNGIAAANLSRLSSMLEDEEYAVLAKRTVQAFEAEIMQHPFLFTSLLDTIVSARLGMKSVVITGDGAKANEAVEAGRKSVNSFRTMVRLGRETKSEWLTKRNGLIGTLDATKTTIQICENRSCRLLKDEEVFKALA
jgi:uncharacterized protein YyaL (SSP411 family)